MYWEVPIFNPLDLQVGWNWSNANKRLTSFVSDSVEDYLTRKKAFSNPKDIVDFLKLLIQRNGSNLLIHDGSTKMKTVGIKAFGLP